MHLYGKKGIKNREVALKGISRGSNGSTGKNRPKISRIGLEVLKTGKRG